MIRHRTPLHSFTLVELLVVMAILGLVAGLAIPAIGKARETANRGGCAANLKTLASAVLAYTADNNGVLPTARVNPNNAGNWWQAALNITNFATNAAKGLSCLYCPSAKWPVRNNGAKVNYPFDTSYGLNAILAGTTNGGTRLAVLPKPSQVVLLADGASYDEDGGHAWLLANGSANTFSRVRHQGGANIAWCDGHVTFENSNSVALLRDSNNWTNWLPFQGYRP